MTRIALLSTSDTDLLCARGSGADYLLANPSRPGHTSMAEAIEAADIVVARILGGPQDLCDGFRRIRATDKPMVVLGGEQTPHAALMELSTVAPGVVAEAHRYLAEGGAANLRELHAFLGDTLLMTGEGFEPPAALPTWGVLDRPSPLSDAAGDAPRPRVGILFYRAQFAAENTAYVHALADAVDAAGGVGVPVHVSSLRDAPADLLEHLTAYDVLITTVLAAGGTKPGTASAGEDDEAWDVQALAALDVPIIQGLCLTWGRDQWDASDDGMSPLDVATQVAMPEFDGRIIAGLFSFKETRRRRAAALRAGPRALRAPRDPRGQPRTSAPHTARRAPGRDRPVGLPVEALAHRQRRGPRHPRLDHPAAALHAWCRLRPRRPR